MELNKRQHQADEAHREYLAARAKEVEDHQNKGAKLNAEKIETKDELPSAVPSVNIQKAKEVDKKKQLEQEKLRANALKEGK